ASAKTVRSASGSPRTTLHSDRMTLSDHLDLLGIIPRQAPPKPAPQPAAYAPPQWKPTYPGEEPPF
ncbi:MAG TPA: hypothetical protein VLA31_07330, partial [Burkholderiaceae bacterium]|nr:hypothetical protein [Burkholderiaceae bacterium]